MPCSFIVCEVAMIRPGQNGLGSAPTERGSAMLLTIAVILVLLWLFGMVSSYTLGGFLHILLFLAIAMILIRVIQGRRAV